MPASARTASAATLWRTLCEHAALAEDRDHALERRAHRADRAERHQQPLPLEVRDDQVEAAALLAEQRVVSHRDVLERDLGGVGRVPAELLERPRGDALAGLDHEERQRPVAGLRPRPHRGDVEVRAHAVGDERLGAVDDPAAVDALGARADGGDVGAGVGLGDRERRDLLAADRGREPALLLRLGAERRERRRGDPDVRADARRRARPSRRARAPRTAPRRRPSRRPARTSARASRARPACANTSFGNERAASHSGACGRSSPSTNARISTRSASCASVNGGTGLTAACAASRTRRG